MSQEGDIKAGDSTTFMSIVDENDIATALYGEEECHSLTENNGSLLGATPTGGAESTGCQSSPPTRAERGDGGARARVRETPDDPTRAREGSTCDTQHDDQALEEDRPPTYLERGQGTSVPRSGTRTRYCIMVYLRTEENNILLPPPDYAWSSGLIRDILDVHIPTMTEVIPLFPGYALIFCGPRTHNRGLNCGEANAILARFPEPNCKFYWAGKASRLTISLLPVAEGRRLLEDRRREQASEEAAQALVEERRQAALRAKGWRKPSPKVKRKNPADWETEDEATVANPFPLRELTAAGCGRGRTHTRRSDLYAEKQAGKSRNSTAAGKTSSKTAAGGGGGGASDGGRSSRSGGSRHSRQRDRPARDSDHSRARESGSGAGNGRGPDRSPSPTPPPSGDDGEDQSSDDESSVGATTDTTTTDTTTSAGSVHSRQRHRRRAHERGHDRRRRRSRSRDNKEKIKTPTFKNETGGVTFDHWYLKIQAYIDSGARERRVKTRIMNTLLDGPYAVVSMLGPEATVAVILEELKKVYGNCQSLGELTEELTSLKQQMTEDIGAFWDRIQRVADRITKNYPTEYRAVELQEQMRVRFFRGMRPDLKVRLTYRQTDPDVKVSDVVAQARKIQRDLTNDRKQLAEYYAKKGITTKPTVRYADTSPTDPIHMMAAGISSFEDAEGEDEDEVITLKAMTQEEAQTHQTELHVAAALHEEKEKTCFICRDPTHWMAECPKRGKAPKSKNGKPGSATKGGRTPATTTTKAAAPTPQGVEAN